MLITRVLLAALCATSTLAALAQGQAPAPPAAPVALPSSPAKKELVAKLLELQRPAVEGMGRTMAEQPALQIMQQVGPFLQRVPVEKREVLAREIEADVRKYVEEAVPIVRDRAVKLAPSTVGTLMDERMTEEELRQVIAALESPAFRKFQTLSGEMQRVFAPKLLAETRPLIEPKVKALEQTVARRLGLPATAASAPAGGGASPSPTPKR
ncbi:MAG: hypothetical protein H7Z19_14250 [Chitinophagaceae bacterium]|nr:hypothetical protein [Rubrivivax sp.]